MLNLLLGGATVAVLFWLIGFVKTQGLNLTWWQWLLTIAGLLYGLFVIELIIGFLDEGAPQAAAVMGSLSGLVAVIWGVLLVRFVFKKQILTTQKESMK